MGATWKLPGKVSEPPGDMLKAFGIESVPGARVNMIDPPTLGERLSKGVKDAYRTAYRVVSGEDLKEAPEAAPAATEPEEVERQQETQEQMIPRMREHRRMMEEPGPMIPRTPREQVFPKQEPPPRTRGERGDRIRKPGRRERTGQ